jgi:hypothetical protein
MGERIAAAIRRPVIIAAIWICALVVLSGNLTRMQGQWRGRDFSDKYESAWALRHAIDPYPIDLTPIASRLGLQTGGLIHASDTPTFLLCFEVLTYLPPRTAFWLWTALNALALAVATCGLLLRRRGLSARTAWLLAGLILMSAPVNLNFYWGQSQLVILMLLVLAMRAMGRERDGTAGLMLAAASLLRAYPVLLVGYFVMRRKWRAVVFAIGGIVAGLLATIATLGFGQTLIYVHGAAWVAGYSMMSRMDNLALGPFVSRVFWALTGAAPGSSIDWARRGIVAAADLALLGIAIRASLAEPNRDDPDWRIYSLWIATAIMLSPVGWHHYLVLFAIPFVQMVAADAARAHPRAIWMAALCYLLSAVSLRVANRFLVPPPTAFQLALPWIARALEEMSFIALLTGYIATYWFATDHARAVTAAEDAEIDQNPRAFFGSTRTTSSG